MRWYASASASLTVASPSTSRVKAVFCSRRARRAGMAPRASRPTMKRCAKPFIWLRMTALASGATGERRPARLMPQRSAAGAAMPSPAKYSRRWRVISARLRRVGKTSAKRNISTLRRSSAMAQSMISPCQRSDEMTEGCGSRVRANRSRAVARIRSSFTIAAGFYQRPHRRRVASMRRAVESWWRGPGGAQMSTASTSISIETFVMDDYPLVHVLWQRSGLFMRPSDDRKETALKLTRDPGLFLVARDAGRRIVGTVLGGWDGRRGYVYHLAVSPERRREGIGGALMDELENRFYELGAVKAKLQIMNENDVSRAFFRARGYELEDFCQPWGKQLKLGGAPPPR